MLRITSKASPRVFISASVVSAAFGIYTCYKDWSRNRRMVRAFAEGNILQPLNQNDKAVKYVRRKEEETRLKEIMKPEVSSQYYVILGEVGVGKTRMMIETVLERIDQVKQVKSADIDARGAPIYILAAQGYSFPDTFAAATRFLFDEHISFKFFLDIVFRVGEMPKRDAYSKLKRVLNAIEKAAFQYLQQTGKPVVLVIDGVNQLPNEMAGALELLQQKAKLWADTNIVKVIFVTNDECTLKLLQKNSSAWSRAATPVVIGDLSQGESIEFLTADDPFLRGTSKSDCADAPTTGENHGPTCRVCEVMPEDHARKVFDLVGGRMQHLLEYKRDWYQGVCIRETAVRLKRKERNKFHQLPESQFKMLKSLLETKAGCIRMVDLKTVQSVKDVNELTEKNILKYEGQSESGWDITFQSCLTEKVAEELIATQK